MNSRSLKVAIVCEWLVGIGGAERIVLEAHRMFPDAPIYTSQYNPKKIDWFNDADVRTGWLQNIPTVLKKFLPLLRAFYFSRLDLSEYDVVITCNFGAEAKAIKAKKGAHICICNAPTHYYWSRYDEYKKTPGFPKGLNWLAKIGLWIFVAPMRRWDFKATQNPDYMVSISTHIQKEIKKYYHRDSEIIHPPVDIERFNHPENNRKDYFVIAGRQTPYKRIDLAVKACSDLNLPLIVIGDGPENANLKKLAGPNVTFTGHLSDTQVAKHFAEAKAFIFPGVDDFGITPVEAMACGTPVISFRGGGPLDYVIPGKNGEFFNEQTVKSLTDALKRFDSTNYSPGDIKNSVQKFSKENFHKNLSQYISKTIQ